VRGWIVPEFDNARMAVEGRLYDAALHPASPSVHDADLGKARRRRGLDVLRDNRGNVARREGMKIELGLDGYVDRVFGHA